MLYRMRGPDANAPRYPLCTLLGRLATYVVPTLAVVVTASVLLGPGATRKAAFVRVYGTFYSGTTTLALRLEGAKRLYGVDERASLENIDVMIHDGTVVLEHVRLTLGPDGIGELLVTSDWPLLAPPYVRIKQGQTLLADGHLPLQLPLGQDLQTLAPANLPGHSTGKLRFFVSVRRGVLAASFPETLDLRVGLAEHVSPTNHKFGGIELHASAPGATLSSDKLVTDEQGHASITITPHAHHVELSIVGKSDVHGEGRWESVLPIIPGAIWLDPDTTKGFEFVSPAPRDRVYLSFTSEHGRVYGQALPVSLDPQGFYRGRLDLGPQLLRTATQVIVAGDPQEQGSGTVAWPLRTDQKVLAAPTIHRLLDGAPAAEERERARANRARRAALLLVLAATVFETLFMLVRSRKSQQRLEERLADMAEGEDRAGIMATARQESPVLRALLAVALVLLAFAMIGALSTLGW